MDLSVFTLGCKCDQIHLQKYTLHADLELILSPVTPRLNVFAPSQKTIPSPMMHVDTRNKVGRRGVSIHIVILGKQQAGKEEWMVRK